MRHVVRFFHHYIFLDFDVCGFQRFGMHPQSLINVKVKWLGIGCLPDVDSLLLVIGHGNRHTSLGSHKRPYRMPAMGYPVLLQVSLDGCQEVIGQHRDEEMGHHPSVDPVVDRP